MREDDEVRSYVRPSFDAPVIRDADGQIIVYGNRWGGQSPPEETYSVDPHPERFAPLHTVADALIEYLTDIYDVRVLESDEVSADLLRPQPDAVRAVRIQPNDPACAALTFVLTTYPGIVMHAGLLHDFHYPVCGCDACDSSWDFEVDDLERTVLAIVTGHYREGVEGERRPRVVYTLTYPGGERSGRSLASDFVADRLQSAGPILRSLSNGWAAWPLAAAGT